jgi:hypothetical protein
MTWFDMLVFLAVAAVVLLETRQEAGRALLDTLATLVAIHLTGRQAPILTGMLGWRPLPGTEVSPLAYGLCFAVLWGLGLLASFYFHRHTRWSMDHFDPVFGLAFGLLIAVTVGHVATDVTARVAIMKHGRVPGYLQESCFADELRSFKSYHFVLDVFQDAQNGR